MALVRGRCHVISRLPAKDGRLSTSSMHSDLITRYVNHAEKREAVGLGGVDCVTCGCVLLVSEDGPDSNRGTVR